MTTDRDIAPLVRSWLRDEPDASAEHVLDRALAVVDTTAQRSAARWPARSTDMNLIVRLGVAAAVLAIAVALGYTVIQNVGSIEPNPSTGPSAPGTASEPPSGPAADLPDELDSIFIGAPRPIEGLTIHDRLVLDPTNFAVHTGPGPILALVSTPSLTEGGELRLVARAVANDCVRGDVGTYPYELSAGGTVLTIGAGTDECAVRAATLPGEWRRSDCLNADNWCLGVLEAGRQSSLFFDPWQPDATSPQARYGAFSYEVPNGWANSDDWKQVYALVRSEEYADDFRFDCTDCPDSVWIGANPSAVADGCTPEANTGVGRSARSLVDWLSTRPGLTVTEQPETEIDGRSAIVIDVAASEPGEGSCRDEEQGIDFVPLLVHDYEVGLRIGDRMRLVLVDVTDDRVMAILIDSRDPNELDELVAEVQPILESIRLTAPTP